MDMDLHERGRWLARYVLPHEGLLRTLLRRTRIHDLDIEDIIQETYTRILSQPSLEAIAYPKQYALMTAKMIVIDHLRRSRVISFAAAGSAELFDVVEPCANAEERLQYQEQVIAVADALSKLPKLRRQIVVMRRIEGLSQKDVASRLGISEKTVEKHMAEAVRLLVKLFGRGGKSQSNTSHGTSFAKRAVRTEDAVDK